ncbi:MAG: DUF1501 domain-containing protein [Gammaproteobacteria bacterium]|nr:DUF1501 domain-containing protein [Gammaproteobacteria bacterium]
MLHSCLSVAGLSWIPSLAQGVVLEDKPILVVVELSGGNDGLNTIVPFADDAYYRHRPNIGIAKPQLLPLDDHFGFNPGMLGMRRLWDENKVAVIHGCGYAQPSYSHFTSMAYWHTGVPHRGDEHGWLGRVADVMYSQRRDDMLINVASSASLAVKSRVHTPVVFDDPKRFARHQWMSGDSSDRGAKEFKPSGNKNRDFLRSVNASAQSSSARIQQAWQQYLTPVDYGIAPMDLPKVAACINAGLPTQLYYVAFRNNAFDTHVQQPALHQRLLSYACDGIHGFIKDLQRLGHQRRVIVMVFSEFGRRVPENANLGTDHGSANNMFVIGDAVRGGHYGRMPSLTELVDGDNMSHSIDFRQVYATVMEDWLAVNSTDILYGDFEKLSFLS